MNLFLTLMVNMTWMTLLRTTTTVSSQLTNGSRLFKPPPTRSFVVDAFKMHEVVPDVVPVAPEALVEVAFGEQRVNLGNELTPTQVQNPPTTVRWSADPNALYTLVMTDPDAPSRVDPKFREFHHWLVSNIPGCDVSRGDVLSAYIGSGPPLGTGLHRYVYLIYKQPGHYIDAEHGHLPDNSRVNRKYFKIAEFATKHNLGHPVAGNFYQAKFDDYVPILGAKLSG